jgi:hypothetical protein
VTCAKQCCWLLWCVATQAWVVAKLKVCGCRLQEHYCLALGVVGDSSGGSAATGWLAQGLRLQLLEQSGSSL